MACETIRNRLLEIAKGLVEAENAESLSLVDGYVRRNGERTSLDWKTLVMDAQVLEDILKNADPVKKGREIEILLIARLRKHLGNAKFVALGERLEKIKEKHEQGFLTSLQFLKEILELAKEVVEAFKKKNFDPQGYTLYSYAGMQILKQAAEKANSFLWIDMEGSAYTEPTLDLYRRLHKDHARTGIALQAYLYRTVGDIAKLMPLEPAIRLVKGAYAESGTIAFAAKKDVDANYLALCSLMLPQVKQGKLRLVLATHDVELIARISRIAYALGLERAQLEVAMLYGIRTDQQLRLAKEGYVVKDLISYGDSWYAWYIRRLAERPANVLFVARQLF